MIKVEPGLDEGLDSRCGIKEGGGTGDVRA
jgi:hypothetical protein